MEVGVEDYWNEWYQSSLFLQNMKVLPLQYRLYKIVNEAQSLKNSVAATFLEFLVPGNVDFITFKWC